MRFTPSIPFLAAITLSGCASAPAPIAPQNYAAFRSTVYLDVGQRCVDSSFDPVDDQTVVGVALDIRQPGASTGLVIGLHHSWDGSSRSFAGVGSVDFDSSTTDFSVGSRWQGPTFWGALRPYAGAGAALIFAQYSTDPEHSSPESGSDWSLGPYFDGGIEWPINDTFLVGLEYRQLLFSDMIKGISLNGDDTDANYSQIALTFGYSF